MPLDIPRDDNFDDSLPDIPGYQLMNVANDENNEEDDSDFDFSSDEEDAPANAHTAPEDDVNSDRYANYELINQGNEADDTAEDAAGMDGENEGDNNQARNRFFQHNFVVQWIETDEPLFDRQEFEARQARHRGENTNSTNQTTSESTDVAESVPVEDGRQNRPEESTIVPSSEPSSSQSDNAQQKETNSQPRNEVKMDNETIDTIKNLMSNFKLPDQSFPGWAKELPEDQWKTFLAKKFDDKSL